jgi:hypothetical protein
MATDTPKSTNAQDLARLVGQTGDLIMSSVRKDDDLRVKVRIEDARVSYGRLDLLVSPIQGTGRMWVSGERVILTDDPKRLQGTIRE